MASTAMSWKPEMIPAGTPRTPVPILHAPPREGTPWVIVLAGGEGTRLHPFLRRWLGQAMPKQFCAFAGRRTMLDHTLDRAVALVGPDRVVTILGAGHERFLKRPLPGHVLIQPASRGTGAGIHLGLSYIRSLDPDATVLILPSDHFVYPEYRFQESAEHALRLCGDYPDKMVLVGIRSREPEPEYGWISAGSRPCPMRPLPGGVHQVRRFVEKPAPHVARLLHQAGWYWNTMICAASVRLLSDCFAVTLSYVSARFSQFESRLVQAQRARFHRPLLTRYLEECFSRLEASDFSSQLVSRIAPRILLLHMQDVDWDDWGRPSRIVQSLERIGRRPNFPVELAGDSLCNPAISPAGLGPSREGAAA